MSKHSTRTVWKFTIPNEAERLFSLDMPAGAEPLTVQMQQRDAQIWALVSPDALTESRRFLIAGTGHEITETVKRYVGTFQMYGGGMVFHVFEVSP